jgi:protein-L-isoaspartate(D-aspartate) O-methyltransferase
MSCLWIIPSLSIVVCVLFSACSSDQPEQQGNEFMRTRMVEDQIAARGVRQPAVLEALRRVPRHEFVPPEYRHLAYTDQPLPIGHGQTISQPYIVALMTELLQVGEGDTVLEIGTGSGYQAAVLAEIVDYVYTIEIVEPLAARAAEDLSRLGYDNVQVRCGDGYRGWTEHAPYDGIIVTAAPPRVPEPLINQLKPGARMVIPVGEFYQELLVLVRTEEGYETLKSIPVRFVPMVGEVQDPPSKEEQERPNDR